MKKYVRLLASVALMLMLSAVLSACSAGQGQASLTGNDVVQKAREALKNNQSAQGSIELSAKLNKAGIKSFIGNMLPNGSKNDTGVIMPDPTDKLPDTVAITLKVWEQSHNMARVEVASASLPGMTGATLVYDGKKAYAYVPSRNTVYTKTPDDTAEMPANMSAMLGDWAKLTPEQRGDKLIAASDIKLLGSEQVSGKDTYKLEIAPKPGALEQLGFNTIVQMMAGNIVNDLKATVWVDKVSFIPVKATLSHPQIGDFTYSSTLDLDKPIDPAQFVLQTPAGAKTVDLDAIQQQMQPKSMTLPQARDEVAKDGWKLLEPTYLPASTTLVEVTRMPAMPSSQSLSTGTWQIQGSGVLTGKMPSLQTGGNTQFGGVNTQTPPYAPVNYLTMVGTDALPSMSPTYMLKYSSPSADFTITESKSQIEKGLGDGYSGVNARPTDTMIEYTVHGVKVIAFFPDSTGWTFLTWQEKSGVWVRIAGKLSPEEVQKIAEGLK